MLRSIGRTGWALAIAASMWGAAVAVAGETGVLPPVPEEPVYTASTRVLIESYPLAPVDDLDGDGSVTDADFVLWIGSQLDRIEMVDVDGDEEWTVYDEAGSLALLLNKLSGDVNASGAVNVFDGLEVVGQVVSAQEIDEYTPINLPTGDINFDLAATMTDVELVLGVATNRPLPEPVEVAVNILAFVGSSTINWAERGHVPSISESYPDGLPSSVPPNHSNSISRTWNPTKPKWWDSPLHTKSVSKLWPANHDYTISDGWGPLEHQYVISRLWPTNHEVIPSESWHPNVWQPEGHSVIVSPHQLHIDSTSLAWDPQHERSVSVSREHDRIYSGRGPLKHVAATSQRVLDPDADPIFFPARTTHAELISLNWGHDIVTSHLEWPPNHEGNFSTTWQPEFHVMNTSIRWPGNHQYVVSTTWKDDKGPRDYPWPPNHHAKISTGWDASPAPDSGPLLWPPDHSILTTIQQVRDLIPTLLPLFGSGGAGQ